jgi:hypothetical protein
MFWLKEAVAQSQVPKESVISVLKKNMSGFRPARDKSQLHASDTTKDNFCARHWAINELQQVKPKQEYLSTALATTYSLGSATARLLIEDWAGDSVVGNWECVKCGTFKSMCTNPGGWCSGTQKHIWKYHEVVFESPKYSITGSIDALFMLGTPLWRVVELKIIAVDMFEKLMAPLPEHRIRTSLYLKLIDESNSVWKSHINLNVGTVLYVSRGYGKKNAEHNDVLPFKEFEVKRDDSMIKQPLQQALALKMFREQKLLPSGICSTALDKPALKCSACKACFSGDYPPNFDWKELAV